MTHDDISLLRQCRRRAELVANRRGVRNKKTPKSKTIALTAQVGRPVSVGLLNGDSTCDGR